MVLCSCASSSNLKIHKIDFSSFNDLNIDYGVLVIDNQFIKKIDAPYIDYYVPEKLSDLINEWSAKRFANRNINSSNILRVVIFKANTLAFPLESEEKIENLWNNFASIRVEMYLEVYIELIDKSGLQLAYSEIKVFKSKELGENTSLNERDYQIQEMSKSILLDFDRLAISKIQEVFKNFIFSS